MYVKKGGKWYPVDSDNDQKGGVKVTDPEGSYWHGEAMAFCKALGLPYEKAIQRPGGVHFVSSLPGPDRPSWAFKIKSPKFVGIKCPAPFDNINKCSQKINSMNYVGWQNWITCQDEGNLHYA